jgi:hypothetical protein
LSQHRNILTRIVEPGPAGDSQEAPWNSE